MRVLFAAVVVLLSLSYGSLKHIESSSGVGIYGGSEVAIKEVPFMAIVYDREHGFICGGTVIEKQYVLTAAHCCKRLNVSHVKVGTDIREEGGQTVEVAKVHVHPQYGVRYTGDSDICVLTLESKLNFTGTVHNILMADKDYKLNESDVLETIGFGRVENGSLPKHLLKVSLPYVPNEKCNHMYNGQITDTMLCAGGEKGKMVCKGDSGSPIFHNGKVVGLSSFVHEIDSDGKCIDDGVPPVFARISALRPFVESIIAQGV